MVWQRIIAGSFKARDHPGLGLAGAVLVVLVSFTIRMGMGRLFGHARTAYHHSPRTISLQRREGGRTISLLDLCKSITPPCRLNPFLFNGHLQTLWTVVKNDTVPIYYKRHIFEHQDPTYAGMFTVDFAVQPYEASDPALPPRTTYFTSSEFSSIGSQDSKPMLVVLHGLSGGSYELYLRHALAPLLIPDQNGTVRWEACVINSRGCAMSKITSSVLYNARATWDMRQTVRWLRTTFPNRPLFAIGFSLGANILTNYLGEEGAGCELKAAMVLSNPWNLDVSSVVLQSTFLGLHVYSRTMGTNMRRLFETHVDQISKNPRIDVEKIRRLRYLHEFDRDVQGPTWGYPTEGAYYRDASSSDSLLAIRIPFFALHARDDPIAADEALPRNEMEQNPYAVLCTTSLGGHLSWFELGGGRWFARVQTEAFFNKMAFEIDVPEQLEVDGVLDSLKNTGDPGRPRFEPMRRKLHVAVDA
ncbi:hypothetical protein EPUS_03996 [Endocarpon pusillum Z07020]|uniref:alcohol O-acetyltransferase n=1 Tax=Endocarpon pusillum (strain Z07020 / HMAS-L-300199) TaxID=1263415 RepID=U1FWQ8_ENDPU|nr:uncharacterized protein EPUS_03996 [Endocarpon pusillum Z07020]ERF69292.1 hypothetical protein EPUS_03996 [Endocarpon pusillum Z07020]